MFLGRRGVAPPEPLASQKSLHALFWAKRSSVTFGKGMPIPHPERRPRGHGQGTDHAPGVVVVEGHAFAHAAPVHGQQHSTTLEHRCLVTPLGRLEDLGHRSTGAAGRRRFHHHGALDLFHAQINRLRHLKPRKA